MWSHFKQLQGLLQSHSLFHPDCQSQYLRCFSLLSYLSWPPTLCFFMVNVTAEVFSLTGWNRDGDLGHYTSLYLAYTGMGFLLIDQSGQCWPRTVNKGWEIPYCNRRRVTNTDTLTPSWKKSVFLFFLPKSLWSLCFSPCGWVGNRKCCTSAT